MQSPGTTGPSRRIALSSLLAAAALVASTPALGGHGGHGKGPGHLERMVEGLDLEPEVRERVYAILDEARAARRDLHKEMRAEHERLRELLEAESPDVDAVMEQTDRLGALRTEMRKQWLRTLLAVRGEIGPERWSEMREALAERRGRHHGER